MHTRHPPPKPPAAPRHGDDGQFAQAGASMAGGKAGKTSDQRTLTAAVHPQQSAGKAKSRPKVAEERSIINVVKTFTPSCGLLRVTSRVSVILLLVPPRFEITTRRTSPSVMRPGAFGVASTRSKIKYRVDLTRAADQCPRQPDELSAGSGKSMLPIEYPRAYRANVHPKRISYVLPCAERFV